MQYLFLSNHISLRARPHLSEAAREAICWTWVQVPAQLLRRVTSGETRKPLCLSFLTHKHR